MNEENGQITSPGYPNPYPLNKQCTWVILAKQGKTIELTFRAFELERNPNCRYDYLEVHDGDGPQMPLLGKFCGDVVPAPVKSSQSTMYIKFYSDGLTPKRGFALKWQTFQRQSPPPGPPPLPGGNKGMVFVYSSMYRALISSAGAWLVAISSKGDIGWILRVL